MLRPRIHQVTGHKQHRVSIVGDKVPLKIIRQQLTINCLETRLSEHLVSALRLQDAEQHGQTMRCTASWPQELSAQHQQLEMGCRNSYMYSEDSRKRILSARASHFQNVWPHARRSKSTSLVTSFAVDARRRHASALAVRCETRGFIDTRDSKAAGRRSKTAGRYV